MSYIPDNEPPDLEPTSTPDVPVWLVLASWVGQGVGLLLFVAMAAVVIVYQLIVKLMEELGRNDQNGQRPRRRPRR